MSTKKVRKCVGCGIMKPAEEMLKLTKDFSSGDIVLNPNSKIFGRSAYLCYNQDCIDQALKKNKLCRVLKTNVSTDLKGILNGQLKS